MDNQFDQTEAKRLLVELIEKLKELNEHLDDIKKMVASFLGWKVIDKKK